jgi:hypothetical protein
VAVREGPAQGPVHGAMPRSGDTVRALRPQGPWECSQRPLPRRCRFGAAVLDPESGPPSGRAATGAASAARTYRTSPRGRSRGPRSGSGAENARLRVAAAERDLQISKLERDLAVLRAGAYGPG